MATEDEGTCSICGKKAPRLEMSVNKVFEEERCGECIKKYGDVPLETLRAALARFDMDIIKIPRDDLDALVEWQREKIDLNRETEKRLAEFGDIDKKVSEIKAKADSRVLKLENARWVFRREKKIERVRKEADEERIKTTQEFEAIKEDAKQKRNSINKEIDDLIQAIKAEMEAGVRKPAEQ